MENKPLFDLGALPEKPVVKPVVTRRWYIVTVEDGAEYALTETHTDSTRWNKIGTFKHQPHLYRTYNGARRAGMEVMRNKNFEVREWKGWKS